MGYTISEFIKIIEADEGVKLLRQEVTEGIVYRIYRGLSGKLVIIDLSEEKPTDDTYKGLLYALGLHYYVSFLFPSN